MIGKDGFWEVIETYGLLIRPAQVAFYLTVVVVIGWLVLRPGRTQTWGAKLHLATAFAWNGVGTDLLRALIEGTEREGIWTLQAGVFPETEGSLRLVGREGFRVVGCRKRSGRMTYGPHVDRCRDVLLLGRGGETVGTD